MTPNDRLRLRPVKAAIVSEISEATVASPVPPQDRVNFHIGNPVQDDRLSARMFRVALGLHGGSPVDDASLVRRAAEDLGIADSETEALEFLLRLVRKSAPYM